MFESLDWTAPQGLVQSALSVILSPFFQHALFSSVCCTGPQTQCHCLPASPPPAPHPYTDSTACVQSLESVQHRRWLIMTDMIHDQTWNILMKYFYWSSFVAAIHFGKTCIWNKCMQRSNILNSHKTISYQITWHIKRYTPHAMVNY